MALSAWLLVFDIARRNLRHPAPLTRYIARCLFLGYFWLALGGVLWLVSDANGLYAGPRYDAILHSVFVGFVFSMIFGHAPIILPALLRIPVPFRPRLYAPLLLLHASLALRVAGQLGGWPWAWQWGGLGNAAAILLFFALIAAAALAELRGPAGSVAAPGDGRR